VPYVHPQSPFLILSRADKKAQDSSTLNGYLYDCSSVQERLARDTKEDRYARDKKQVDKFEKRFEGKQ
jgi:hypothetical protein